ncbi:hypothetical protein I5677_01900 [Mobilitalea sibirica]|uniref:YhfM-like domain-containing protein n=1 Tax=Mobilitalea sibirica TaxID=1462919 RepID=A0A8J7H0I4_9FIRM|nr:hypothetical protein [Mobilitalea sibirica]MBH1939644.1 hypothetical protein [Mobilitalea sibirica]
MKKRFSKIAIVSVSTFFIVCFLIIWNKWNDTLVFSIFIDRISVYETPDFHQKDGTLIKVVEDNRSIQTIVNSINSADQMPGVLDVAMPMYQITLTYKNKKEVDVLLWLSKDDIKGMCMLKQNNHVGYIIDEERTKSLINLLL